MEVTIHKFPTMNDGVARVEETYCDLLNKYRNGEVLDEEAIDWLDSANSWLMAI